MKLAILGAAESGVGAAILAQQKSYEVFVSDMGKIQERYKLQLDQHGIAWEEGKHTAERILDADEVIKSPGIPDTAPMVQRILEAGIPIISEIEFAARYTNAKMLCITGSNGKTTTTSLTYEIVKKWNENTLLVGNIEIPYTGLALESVEGGATVAEISSFQLETMLTFKPKVSAILNITPDHLDRHKTMENYADVKKSIAKNQNETDFCILNYEDDVLREFGKELKCNAVFFSSLRELSDGLYYKDGVIYLAEKGESTPYIRTDETNLVGLHNFENIMAAIAMTKAFGVPDEIIKQAVRDFVAVEHRIEFVAEIKGVKYYNDSKGTNTDAAIKAIDAMPSKTVLIAGGYDKKSEYDEWVSRFPGKVRKLVLIGQTRENIAATCDKIGFKDYCFADSLEEAVKICAESAKEGDCCLLSPACASWGMFKNYQQRGTMFKQYVKELE